MTWEGPTRGPGIDFLISLDQGSYAFTSTAVMPQILFPLARIKVTILRSNWATLYLDVAIQTPI